MKIFLSMLFISNVALAHSEFVGTLKGTNLPCSVHIEQIYYVDNIEKPENLRADIVASLQDDHHLGAHGEEFLFTVQPSARADVLSGMGSNQKDQINVLRKAGSSALDVLESFAVKWWHVNHFHSAQCKNLKRVQE